MGFAVLGNGVAALCCANALVEKGVDIEVVEPDDGGVPASWLAGGMLAPFCEGEVAAPEIVRDGQKALPWWSARVPNVERRGTLVVAAGRDRAELDQFAQRTQNHKWVAPADLEPSLGQRFERALFFEDEGHLDPRLALSALRERLIKRGVRFTHQQTRSKRIDCRGWAARDVLHDMRGVRGEMLIVRTSSVTLTRPIRLLHPRFPCYIVPREDNKFLIGATMIESSNPGPVTVRSAVELLSSAFALHQGFAEAEIVELSAGVRPAFSDNIPMIREIDGHYFVNGMFRHGFLMAPILAERLARHICQEEAYRDG